MLRRSLLSLAVVAPLAMWGVFATASSPAGCGTSGCTCSQCTCQCEVDDNCTCDEDCACQCCDGCAS